MNSRLAFAVLSCLALVQAQSTDQLPVINTPASVVQCLPSLLTFSGSSPPYTISAIPAGQVGAAPLVDLGSQNGTSYTWKVNLAGNTAITLQIRDSRGAINYAQAVTVQPSSDSSCLGSNGGGGSSTPPSSTTTPTTPSPPASTGVSTTPPASPSPTPPAGSNSSAVPGNNAISAQRPNSTLPTAGSNTTANTTSATNQTRGPSVFTPSSTSANSSAASNASNSAAPGTTYHYEGLLTGLAVAAAALTLFA